MRILIIGGGIKIFRREFAENMKKYFNIEFDILCMGNTNYYSTDDNNRIFGNIYYLENNKTIIKQIPKLRVLYNRMLIKKTIEKIDNYNICHIHSLSPFYGLIINEIKRKCKHIVTSYYGSDFYRTTLLEKKLQKNVLKKSDVITFTNEKMMDSFNNFYFNNFKEKTKVVRFGLKPLEYINLFKKKSKKLMREEFNIPSDAFVITCGYKASKMLQIEKILLQMNLVKKLLQRNFFLIFPMTYGVKEVTKNIENILKQLNFRYLIVKNFLSNEDVAKLKLISDVFIHVPISDQLSGAMQEYIYADNVILTGDWLPYDIFDENGISLIKVSSLKEIGEKMVEIIRNYSEYKDKNLNSKEKIWELSSWNSNANKWYELYKNLYS